jgi:hypothetical protein
MVNWHSGSYALEMFDDPNYTFQSVDNTRKYDFEHLFGHRDSAFSKHGVVCSTDGRKLGSAILGTYGGATLVKEHSLAVLKDRCFAAVGMMVACLALPDLSLVWSAKGDSATCFGLHLAPNEDSLIVHGELAITKLSLSGEKQWEFMGQDIFTGKFSVEDQDIIAEDFECRWYHIRLDTGIGEQVSK